MSSGSVSHPRSYRNVSPPGGGGVYVATGEVDMLGGEITGNNSVRQGGGVFVYRKSVFNASGKSSITGNEGVGSSKDICSRGITELIGDTQVGKVYVWNADPVGPLNENFYFFIGEGARISGIVLAHPTSSPPFDPSSGVHHNVIDIGSINGETKDLTGSGPVCRIDLEMNLVNGAFATTDINAWKNKVIVRSSTAIDSTRFPMNTLVGKSTLPITNYEVNSTDGKLVKP
jgi:hypothetical protein